MSLGSCVCGFMSCKWGKLCVSGALGESSKSDVLGKSGVRSDQR